MEIKNALFLALRPHCLTVDSFAKILKLPFGTMIKIFLPPSPLQCLLMGALLADNSLILL